MSERSPLHKKREKQVSKSHTEAMLLFGAAFLGSQLYRIINPDRANHFLAKVTGYSKTKYHAAIDDLREVETDEDYPVVRRYVADIKQISDQILATAKQRAYYPYAGLDLFWAAGFNNLVMEDKNYDASRDDPTLWWKTTNYETSDLQEFLSRLKRHGVIKGNPNVNFLASNSETSSAPSDFNLPDTTLIYKAGHDFEPFLGEVFSGKQLNFGAIIVTNDRTRKDKLKKLLSPHDYSLAYELNPPQIPLPWALSLRNPQVFLMV
jgi:hypothetical protein